MKGRPIEVISRRLDFLSMVLADLAMSLPPQEAARAARAIGQRVVQHLESGPVSETADEATGELGVPIGHSTKVRFTLPRAQAQIPTRIQSTITDTAAK